MTLDKLKAIINHIDIFDRATLSGRIRFQKSIFLIQKLGLDLEYKYIIYHYGPYSSELAHDMYKLDENNLISSLKLTEEEENILDKFKELVKSHENDTVWLEMAATIVFEKIKHENEMFKLLTDRHGYFDDKNMFKSVIDRLKRFNLITS